MTDQSKMDPPRHPPLSNERKNEIADQFMEQISREAFPGDQACADCVTEIMMMTLVKYRTEVLIQKGALTKQAVDTDIAWLVTHLQLMFISARINHVARNPHLVTVN